jgi:hypothetical protein
MYLRGLCGPVPAQNVNFAANCNCRALNIVLGEPKLEFEKYGAPKGDLSAQLPRNPIILPGLRRTTLPQTGAAAG